MPSTLRRSEAVRGRAYAIWSRDAAASSDVDARNPASLARRSNRVWCEERESVEF